MVITFFSTCRRRINLALPLPLKLNRRKANDTLLVISERRATRERRRQERERERGISVLRFYKEETKGFQRGNHGSCVGDRSDFTPVLLP